MGGCVADGRWKMKASSIITGFAIRTGRGEMNSGVMKDAAGLVGDGTTVRTSMGCKSFNGPNGQYLKPVEEIVQ